MVTHILLLFASLVLHPARHLIVRVMRLFMIIKRLIILVITTALVVSIVVLVTATWHHLIIVGVTHHAFLATASLVVVAFVGR